MEPTYITESIQKLKETISSVTNPFTLHTGLSYFAEQIETCLLEIREEAEALKSNMLPSLQESKDGVHVLDGLNLRLTHLRFAANSLEEINTCRVLEQGEALCALDTFIRVDTAKLLSDINLLELSMQETTTRYQLLRDYQLYKAWISQDLSTSEVSPQTPRQLAGQYVYLAGGDLTKARELLLGVTEQIYTAIGEERFLSNTGKIQALLSAQALLAPKEQASPAPANLTNLVEKTSWHPSTISAEEAEAGLDNDKLPDSIADSDPEVPAQEEEGIEEAPPAAAEEAHLPEEIKASENVENGPQVPPEDLPEETADLPESDLPDPNELISGPSAGAYDSYSDSDNLSGDFPQMNYPDNIPPELTEEDARELEKADIAAQDAESAAEQTEPSVPEPPKPKKMITDVQYEAFCESVKKLEQQHKSALQKQIATQKEVGNMNNCNEDQVKKMVQAQSAVRDVKARLNKATDKLKALNASVQKGEIVIVKTSPNSKVFHEEFLKNRNE